MPSDKDFKALVRSRVALTGERYTQARAALDRRREPPTPWLEWVEALADPERYELAYHTLKALSPENLRPLVTAATRHPDWRVRRGACRLLDDLDFTAESFAALQACLDDADARVRRAAVHSLACQHCKPEGCVVDVRPVFERALRDPSRAVRQMVVGPLTYGSEEPWRIDLLRQVLASDPSPKLRDWARQGLEHFEERRRSDAQRRRLPAELLAKTERHFGKWVAISEGQIIDAGGHSTAMERTARRHGRHDVRVFWVARPRGDS